MTRAEKIQFLIDNCIAKMESNEKDIYKQIAEYAVELGYTPKPVKTAQGVSDDLTFTKAKYTEHL